MQVLHEPSRNTPVVDRCDVLVAGAGPAGVCAAIAAACGGASVRLVENHGCLGGVWTSGLLAWVLDSAGKAGLLAEILQRLESLGACQPAVYGGVAFDVEQMKLLLEAMCAEAGVGVRLHTRIVAAESHQKRLRTAVTESKSGREAWSAKVFIDCTGDGDLAARAGCGFDVGRSSDGFTQPMSLLCLVAGAKYEDIHPFVHDKHAKSWREDSARIMDACRRGGVEPSYGAPVLFRIHDDLYAMMANHEHAHALDAQSISDATIRARREVHAIVAALRQQGAGWSGLRVVATASQIGVREGRRVRGLYTLSAEDLRRGARFEDGVCHVTFPVDIHAADSYGNAGIQSQPYDIPLRSLIAADMDGLLMAGRCISGDFIAHGSYRVTGNAAAMGEAAGHFAARCVRDGVSPHEAVLFLTET